MNAIWRWKAGGVDMMATRREVVRMRFVFVFAWGKEGGRKVDGSVSLGLNGLGGGDLPLAER